MNETANASASSMQPRGIPEYSLIEPQAVSVFKENRGYVEVGRFQGSDRIQSPELGS